MRLSLLALWAALPLLAACASPGKREPQGAAPPPAAPRTHSRVPPVRPPVRQAPPPAQPLAAPGLEGVIGSTAGDLARQFGTPRLEVWEGDARKLQFSGNACVLDVYLYPGAAGREPQATYLDARRASDGKDVDRASCIAALRQRGSSPPPAAGATSLPGG
jgi:hypothetical protein